MRITFECYSTYNAILCVVLTGALAIGISDNTIDIVAEKLINITGILYGPVLFIICSIGWSNIKAMCNVCGVRGIVKDEFNGVSIFILIIFTLFSIGVSLALMYEKTIELAI